MKKQSDQRKLTNVIVDTGAQLRLSIPFFVLLIITVVSILMIYWQVDNVITTARDTMTSADLAFIAQLQQLSTSILAISFVGLTLMGFLCLVMWMTYSHRIFGPAVAFTRHVRLLRDGDYTTRIHLRKRDEFKDLAADLNELAKVLQAKSSQPTETKMN